LIFDLRWDRDFTENAKDEKKQQEVTAEYAEYPEKNWKRPELLTANLR